jgi:hypothetical protein
MVSKSVCTRQGSAPLKSAEGLRTFLACVDVGGVLQRLSSALESKVRRYHCTISHVLADVFSRWSLVAERTLPGQGKTFQGLGVTQPFKFWSW